MGFMAKKEHVSETPATHWLKANQIPFTEHPYDYLAHGCLLYTSDAADDM
jgi:hypothetical protein